MNLQKKSLLLVAALIMAQPLGAMNINWKKVAQHPATKYVVAFAGLGIGGYLLYQYVNTQESTPSDPTDGTENKKTGNAENNGDGAYWIQKETIEILDEPAQSEPESHEKDSQKKDSNRNEDVSRLVKQLEIFTKTKNIQQELETIKFGIHETETTMKARQGELEKIYRDEKLNKFDIYSKHQIT